jgi:hypothetical protein
MDASARDCRLPIVTIVAIIASAVSLGAEPTWAQRAPAKSDFEGTQVGSVPPGFLPRPHVSARLSYLALDLDLWRLKSPERPYRGR